MITFYTLQHYPLLVVQQNTCMAYLFHHNMSFQTVHGLQNSILCQSTTLGANLLSCVTTSVDGQINRGEERRGKGDIKAQGEMKEAVIEGKEHKRDAARGKNR